MQGRFVRILWQKFRIFSQNCQSRNLFEGHDQVSRIHYLHLYFTERKLAGFFSKRSRAQIWVKVLEVPLEHISSSNIVCNHKYTIFFYDFLSFKGFNPVSSLSLKLVSSANDSIKFNLSN